MEHHLYNRGQISFARQSPKHKRALMAPAACAPGSDPGSRLIRTDIRNRSIRFSALLAVFVGLQASHACYGGEQSRNPIDVGTRKQLLFDDLFLEQASGITLRMNPPFQHPEPVLVADKPWEQRVCAYNTVMHDQGKLRMWYDVITYSSDGRQKHRLLCYAESADGVHWEKPDLGLITFDGSKNNNIVAPPSPNASQQGATVFRDDHAPPSERYKLWTKYEASKEDEDQGIRTGLWAMVSPDGLRWRLLHDGYPLGRGNAADSQNICFWDDDVGKYVGFVRMKRMGPEPRKRTCWVGLMTSDDFRNWTRARSVFYADEQMPVPGGEPDWRPVVDLYTPGGMKVPNVPDAYVLLPTPYYHWGKDSFPATIDVALATSRDRVNWWRPADPEPFLRLGPDGSASAGMIFANPWPIVMGDEIWIYYKGTSRHHTASVKQYQTAIFRARLRLDGFVSADAGYKGGEFTTPVITFGGRHLVLNMDGSAGGWLQVEILSAEGKPVSGYQLDRCDTIRGNSVRKVVTWQGKPDVSELAGKPVRLRFVMRSMKLFAFQFVKAEVIPEPSYLRTDTRQLSLSNGLTICIKGDPSGPVGYAAEQLCAELSRRFDIEASLTRSPTKGSDKGALVLVGRTTDPQLMTDCPELMNVRTPGPDGYLVGVFPDRRLAAVAGSGGCGCIRGVFALAQLTTASSGKPAWPQAILADTPEIRIRMARGIGRSPSELDAKGKALYQLDWWARCGLNYIRVSGKNDEHSRWYVDEARRRGMKVGVSIGGKHVCASDPEEMQDYLSGARRALEAGCDFLHILYDDLDIERFGGHCEKCVKKFGGSLAREQRCMLEALQDLASEFGPDRKIIWCPTYYSLGMAHYTGAAESPEQYFSILGASPKVGKTWMYHCAFNHDFAEYLNSKGLTRRIWWYNGLRTYYYMVKHFTGNKNRPRIPGFGDFDSIFPMFEHGWLMPGFANTDPSIHACISPLAPARSNERGQAIIPPGAWQELAGLPERMDGVYLCCGHSPYHAALGGVFDAHPRLFDQRAAEHVIFETMFGAGAAPYAGQWQKAYARAQIMLAEARGAALTDDPLREVRDLARQMAAMENSLRLCMERGSPAVPTSVLTALLEDMGHWRGKILSLAAGTPESDAP